MRLRNRPPVVRCLLSAIVSTLGARIRAAPRTLRQVARQFGVCPDSALPAHLAGLRIGLWHELQLRSRREIPIEGNRDGAALADRGAADRTAGLLVFRRHAGIGRPCGPAILAYEVFVQRELVQPGFRKRVRQGW